MIAYISTALCVLAACVAPQTLPWACSPHCSACEPQSPIDDYVDELCAKLLKADSLEKKREIIREIGSLEKDAKQAVPTLIRFLSDATTFNKADETLFRTLNSGALNCEAAIALAKIGGDAVASLAKILEQRNSSRPIRMLALAAIVRIEDDTSKASSAIVSLLSDDSEDLRVDALEALPKVNPKSRDVRRAILGAFDDQSDYVRVVAAAVLLEVSKDNVISVPCLSHYAASVDSRTQWRAITDLGLLGSRASSAVAVIGKQLQSKDLTIQIAAAKALGRIGPESREFLPLLMRLQADENKGLRNAAVDAVLQIKTK